MSNNTHRGSTTNPRERQSAAELQLHEHSQRSLGEDIRPQEHLAQFYETDTFLTASLGEFVAAGLRSDEAVIVVAMPEHRAALEAHLRDGGWDVAALLAAGQLVALDAAESLASFMAGDMPDQQRFDGIFAHTIASAGRNRSGTRVFGEMVTLLWTEGQHAAALQLEQLWNDLQARHRFTLFCAYPIKGFHGAALEAPFRHVCDKHTRIVPAESYTSVDHADDRLRAIVLLQQKASLLEAEIAERKAVEHKLRETSRLKDEFLATVSHELRTPLTVIIGWAQRLQRAQLDAAVAAHGAMVIERSARAQAQLIEDILDVSRVITGKLRLDIVAVDMAEIINAAVDSVQMAADAKSIQLRVTLDPASRHLSGDASRLQQVVWNLLSNAIKFTPDGGQVDVRLERVDTQVQISVTDSGEGIEPEFVPFLFDRFTQADSTSTRQHGGLGLGLAIVRHLVELHGGTVQAFSAGLGCGATFTVRLPGTAFDEQAGGSTSGAGGASARAAGVTHASALALRGVRVLLVDDDRDTLQILSLLLSEAGAQVQSAGSAGAALHVLEWFQPDVLVSDLAMPGEDGCALLQKVQERQLPGEARIPAIALTAYTQEDNRERLLSAGFDLFVAKPVEPAKLVAAIAGVLVSCDGLQPTPERLDMS